MLRPLLASTALIVSTAVACAHDTPLPVGLVRDDPLRVGELSLPHAVTERTVPLRAQTGQVMILLFGYLSCPDVCPTSLTDLRAALRRLGPLADSVTVAFVTVDPDRDSGTAMAEYLDFFADRNLPLRTEDPGQLATVLDAFLATADVSVGDDGRVQVEHTATAFLIDDSGIVAVELPFGSGPDGFEHDLRLVLGGRKT